MSTSPLGKSLQQSLVQNNTPSSAMTPTSPTTRKNRKIGNTHKVRSVSYSSNVPLPPSLPKEVTIKPTKIIPSSILSLHHHSTHDKKLRELYEELIRQGNEEPNKLEMNLYQIRRLILLEGLPPESKEEHDLADVECSLRGKIWKILLRVKKLEADRYIELIEKGCSTHYQKIRNDTFRTFKNDSTFSNRVPEEKLIRVLNAFIHSCDRGALTKLSYVQGMNVVCAPFLYVMPELDAFSSFSHFIKNCAPVYFYPGIDGAFEGLKLLDEILRVVDPELYSHLLSKNLKADVYAMPPVLSFSACTPPLDELLRLWDFFIAFGVHLNVVCVAAQIILIREELLTNERPNTLLRTLPPLNTNSIISVAVQLVRQLPDELYKDLVVHPFQQKKNLRKYATLPKNFKQMGERNLYGDI